MHRCVISYNFVGRSIDKVDSRKKGLVPILKRHGGISKKSKTHLNNVTVLAFSRAFC